MKQLQPIYLVCGTPGSGKTWVCRQLADKFTYVPHDDYPVQHYGKALMLAAETSDKPVIGEGPFRITVLVDELLPLNRRVRPFFIVEQPHIVKARYEAREHKPILSQHLTRIDRMIELSHEFGRPMGTSAEILQMLKEEKV
jgi:hypothetical protein